jgi:hypothetical protein
MLFQFGEDIISLHDEASTTFLSRRGATEYLRLTPNMQRGRADQNVFRSRPGVQACPPEFSFQNLGAPKPGDIE